MSVGTAGTQDDTVLGLQWATGAPTSTKIVNYSEAVYGGLTVAGYTRAFDYWSRQNNVFVTVAAGNSVGNDYVASPAVGWNVLAVGNFDNQNTRDWSDDSMTSDSSWRNPASAHSDREKPEVVAIGQNLSVWGWNNVLEANLSPGGTSYAAPQVAGLCALLINRNPGLALWPEVCRAIIMASAIHNIEGSPRITPTVDVKDGAGAIVADQAIATAALRGSSSSPCYVSCWWGELINNNTVPRGNSLNRTFYALAGQRVRIAISWWATADGPPNYTNDKLDFDFDLKVKNPSGVYFTNSTSTSYDNNYELVDLEVSQTGTYTIEVYNTWQTDPAAFANYVGIALVIPRYYIYLPVVLK